MRAIGIPGMGAVRVINCLWKVMHRDYCLDPGFIQVAVFENKHLRPAINKLYLAFQRQDQQVEVLESMVHKT